MEEEHEYDDEEMWEEYIKWRSEVGEKPNVQEGLKRKKENATIPAKPKKVKTDDGAEDVEEERRCRGDPADCGVQAAPHRSTMRGSRCRL